MLKHVLALPRTVWLLGLIEGIAEAAFAFSATCALVAALLLKFWVMHP